MGELGVDGCSDQGAVALLEVLVSVSEGADLCRADEGEVERVEEEHDVLSLVVLEGDLLELEVVEGGGLEVRGWLSDDGPWVNLVKGAPVWDTGVSDVLSWLNDLILHFILWNSKIRNYDAVNPDISWTI